LNSQEETIHIPNLFENSGDVVFISEFEQEADWTKDSKEEWDVKKLGFSQGCINILVILCFFGK
jgi:hypothetical protein